MTPSDNEVNFPSIRLASSLIKAFGSSFTGSLFLLNVQQQKRPFLAPPCRINHQYKVDTVEWFHRSRPTGGGRQLGLSRPVRTETVNTAMAPALLSGTNRGRGRVVRGLTSLYPPVSPHRAKKRKKALSCLWAGCDVRQVLLEFNYCSLLPAPVISLFQSYALAASQCHTLFPKNYLFHGQPARVQTARRYRADLDPFSPPFCLNLITLHLGECHDKLWGYNGAVSNECSIKPRAPTRQSGPSTAE